MPAKNSDLHGQAPDASEVALLLIDVINDLEFEGGDALLTHALPAARRIRALKRRAKEAGIPVIYANDNFGRWRSNFEDVVQHSLHDGVRGQPIAELLQPEEDDYFVLKPKHSAFFATTMDTLAQYLDLRTLILTGFAGDICILFTALDAHMRDFNIVVPRDCIASQRPEDNEATLRYIERICDGDTRPSTDLDFGAMLKQARTEAA